MTKTKLRFLFGPNEYGQFYWRIKSRNGEIIAQGEGYKTKAKCRRVYDILGYEANSDICTVVELDAAGKPVKQPRYAGTLVTSGRATEWL